MTISFAQHLPAKLTQALLDMLASDYRIAPDILRRIQDLCQPLEDAPEGFISLEQFAQARDMAIDGCDDPWLGFKFARRLVPLRLGALGGGSKQLPSCRRDV